jgi:mannose-1-phosphate guanylyltransferase
LGDAGGNTWVIVLAAGEGRRLSALTRGPEGQSVPKQYCSFGQDRCMLQWALARALAVAPLENIVPIVAEEHRAFWERELEGTPGGNVVVQPRNRGTAAGILLPLVRILARDPDATVCVLPADHYVENEDTLKYALRAAVLSLESQPDRIVLLGITPEEVDTEYGWILPRAGGGGWTQSVERFVEKPDPTAAMELLLQGALWNSFVFAGRGRTLLRVIGERLPALHAAFLTQRALADDASLGGLYEEIPSKDFSRDVLEGSVDWLSLFAVPSCGWSDLGTPSRLGRFLEQRASAGGRPAAIPASRQYATSHG